MNFKSRHTLLGISAIFLCFLRITSGGYASLINNAYTNVVVAISQDIPTDNTLDDRIKDLFQKTSEVLYNATGHRAYFGDIAIVGPSGVLKSGALFRAKRGAGNQWQSPIPSFDSADVRIDLANLAYGDVPYTQQSRGCGEPGDFIHLTPDFLTSTTDLWLNAKSLANEWMKYRYGVFDENGYNWNEVYPVMYYGQDGQPMFNLCSNNSDVVWQTESCSEDSNIEGLYQMCTLEPDTNGANTNVNSSMMSKPIIELATQYCTNSSDHNSDAPNKQNLNCNGKSIMEVVLQHADFANGKNTARNEDFGSLSSLVFNPIVSNDYIGLVVVSDLMEQNKTLYNIKPSTGKFITVDFPTDSYFGFIQNVGTDPNTKYTTISNFVAITGNSTRKSASDAIHSQVTHNSTKAVRQNIADSVTAAIDLLNGLDNTFNKGILLISDQLTFGSSADELATICFNANSSKIQLHLITFNGALYDAFNSYGNCPGQVYLIQAAALPSSVVPSDLTVCYADMQRRAQMENALMNLPATMLPDKFDRPTVFFEQMYTNTVSNGTFFVDADVVSGEAAFYVETCSNEIYHNTPIGGLLECRISNGSTVKYDLEGEAFIDISTINTSGSYNFRVTNMQEAQGQIPYVVYAVGKPYTRSSSTRQKTSVLNTKAWVIAEEVNGQSWTKVRIFAEVKNGSTPIFDAHVNATIITSTSAGKSTNYTVTLRDDGSGNPDISAQDGIYSAYFTQFVNSNSMQYSVSVLITDNDGAASYPTTAYPWLSGNDMQLQNCPSFQRMAQTNAFSAKGPSSGKYIPPGKVTDFRIQSINGAEIGLTWTAPGDDLDYGRATSYVFNCHINSTYLQGLKKLDSIDLDSNLPSATPQQAGSAESTSFEGHYDQTVHYCAMQAVDRSNTYGNVSNIISYFLISNTVPGLSSASIAGIVVGVILGIILLIAIIVLIWWCLAGRNEQQEKRPDPEDNEQNPESTKLKPIPFQAPIPVDQRSNALVTEAMQNNSRPASMHSLAHSNHSGYDGNGSDDDEAKSNYSKHTNGMQTFQQGKPYGIPVLPSEDFQMQPIGGSGYGSPGYRDPGEQFDSTYLMANADQAIPTRLAKLAVIEDVGEYHDKNILKGTPNTRDEIQDYRNLPVYGHMLNKPGPPQPPPRSASSSQSSLSNIGNPKSISQV